MQLGSACHEGDVVGCRINFAGAVNFGGAERSQGPPVSATWSRNGVEIGTVKFDDNHSGRFSQEVRLSETCKVSFEVLIFVNSQMFTSLRNCFELALQVSEIYKSQSFASPRNFTTSRNL